MKTEVLLQRKKLRSLIGELLAFSASGPIRVT
jgi:hypothetical protein